MATEESEPLASEPIDDVSENETRIALAFFGGVSLAAYESGVALEFFRLVTEQKGIYRDLRDLIGPVMVDIISGTSAGGLSAAFLANALVNESAGLEPLIDLWVDEAGLDTLLNPPDKKGAQSLLDGDRFLELILKALHKTVGSKRPLKSHQRYLDLFITATSLEGDNKDFYFGGAKITTRSHQRVFHFRYRGTELGGRNVGEEAQNDFDPDDAVKLSLLAEAARASASFPLAFEPILITRERFARLSPALKKDSFHIDGGILDNKPIRLAVDAIFRRRKDKQVDRRFFYVEPMPEETNASESTEGAREHPRHFKPLNVLYAAIKDLPSYQSITSALAELEERNRQVDELRGTLHHYETLAAKAEQNTSGYRASLTKLFRRMARFTGASRVPMATNEYYPATSTPTRLFRAQEDGYLDLRLSRNFDFPPKDELPEPNNTIFRVFRAISESLEDRPEKDSRGYARTQEAFYHLKTHVLWTYDFEFHRRQYHYLHQVVNDLFTQVKKSKLIRDQNDRNRLLRVLNKLRRLFNKQEGEVAQMQRLAKNRDEEDVIQLKGRFTDLLNKFKGLSNPKGAADLFYKEIRELAERGRIKERWDHFEGLRSETKNQLKREGESLDVEGMVERNDSQVRHAINLGYNRLLAALDQFYQRDMIIYPMMHGNDMLASELQHVLMARFGPLEGHRFVRCEPKDKLAGEEAMRFGGFMDRTWRGNDLVWGRLDAVENIFSQLLPGGDTHPLFMRVHDEQKEILKEMKIDPGIGIVHPLDDQDENGNPPRSDQLIGRRNLHHIEAKKKVEWLQKGATILARMVPLPEGVVPKWAERHLSRFFVGVLTRPRRTSTWAATFVGTLLAAPAILIALAIVGWLNWPNPSWLGWTGDFIAIVSLFVLMLAFWKIASLAHLVRAKLKIDTVPNGNKIDVTDKMARSPSDLRQEGDGE